MKKLGYLIEFGREFLGDSKINDIHPNIFFTMKDLVAQIRSDLQVEFQILLEGLRLPQCFIERLEERRLRIRELINHAGKQKRAPQLDSFVIEEDCASMNAESVLEMLRSSLVGLNIRHVEFAHLQKNFRMDVILGRIPEMNEASFFREDERERTPGVESQKGAFVSKQKLIAEVVGGVDCLERLRSTPITSDGPLNPKLLCEINLVLNEMKADSLFGFTQCAFQLIKGFEETTEELEGRVSDLLGKLITLRKRTVSAISESPLDTHPQFSAFLSIIGSKNKGSPFTLLDDRFNEDIKGMLDDWRSTSRDRIGSIQLIKVPMADEEEKGPSLTTGPRTPPPDFEPEQGFCSRVFCNIF